MQGRRRSPKSTGAEIKKAEAQDHILEESRFTALAEPPGDVGSRSSPRRDDVQVAPKPRTASQGVAHVVQVVQRQQLLLESDAGRPGRVFQEDGFLVFRKKRSKLLKTTMHRSLQKSAPVRSHHRSGSPGERQRKRRRPSSQGGPNRGTVPESRPPAARVRRESAAQYPVPSASPQGQLARGPKGSLGLRRLEPGRRVLQSSRRPLKNFSLSSRKPMSPRLQRSKQVLQPREFTKNFNCHG